MSQRVEPIFFFLKKWLKVLIDPFKILIQRIVTLFSSMTQKVEPFFEYDSKNWTSILCELFDSKELNFSVFILTRFFLDMTPKKLNSSSKKTQEFNNDSQKLKNSKKKTTQKYDSKNWTFFQHDSKNWTFFQYDSKELSTFVLDLTQRIEPLFLIWLKELNLSF